MANIYIFLYSLSIGIADTYISYNKTRKSLSIDSTAKKNLDGKLMVSHFKLTDRPLKLKRTLNFNLKKKKIYSVGEVIFFGVSMFGRHFGEHRNFPLSLL